MKKFLIGLGLIALVLLAGVSTANASMWEKLQRLRDEAVDSVQFVVEAYGYGLRGYMFRTPDGKRECLFMAGSQKGGLDCWEVDNQTVKE